MSIGFNERLVKEMIGIIGLLLRFFIGLTILSLILLLHYFFPEFILIGFLTVVVTTICLGLGLMVMGDTI